MAQVKICGLTRVEDVQACAYYGAEWVGFVFHPASPRYISPQHAQMLHQSIDNSESGGPKRVGLFVKPTEEYLRSVLDHVSLDILQLYTSFEKALYLRDIFQKPVWLARGISSSSDLPLNAQLDGYIIEAPAQTGDTRPGGLGRSFDWSLTKEWVPPTPWLLAGGLNPSNVEEALRISHALAVDVSSGVEIQPGYKSAELIRNFIKKSS